MSAPSRNELSVSPSLNGLSPPALALYRVLGRLAAAKGDGFSVSYQFLGQLHGSRRKDDWGSDESIGEAASELALAGLIRRERVVTDTDDGPGTPYRWWLVESPLPPHDWPEAEAAIEAVWEHLIELGRRAPSVFERLALAADADGTLTVSPDDLRAISGFEERAALRHIERLVHIRAGVTSCLIVSRRPKLYALRLEFPSFTGLTAAPATATDQAELAALLNQLWPGSAKAVAQAIAVQEERALLSLRQQANCFYRPALELQQAITKRGDVAGADLYAYVVSETTKKLPDPDFGTFARYSTAVLRNAFERKTWPGRAKAAAAEPADWSAPTSPATSRHLDQEAPLVAEAEPLTKFVWLRQQEEADWLRQQKESELLGDFDADFPHPDDEEAFRLTLPTPNVATAMPA
jgi:hypothetical protein